MPLYWCGPAGGWQGAELLDATKEAAKHGGLEDSFVVGIEVNHGEFVNSVVLNLRQGATGENWDLQLGGMRVGKREYIVLNRGEFVSGIWGASGQFVDSIAIELSSSMSGRVTRTFGPFGGAESAGVMDLMVAGEASATVGGVARRRRGHRNRRYPWSVGSLRRFDRGHHAAASVKGERVCGSNQGAVRTTYATV